MDHKRTSHFYINIFCASPRYNLFYVDHIYIICFIFITYIIYVWVASNGLFLDEWNTCTNQPSKIIQSSWLDNFSLMEEFHWLLHYVSLDHRSFTVFNWSQIRTIDYNPYQDLISISQCPYLTSVLPMKVNGASNVPSKYEKIVMAKADLSWSQKLKMGSSKWDVLHSLWPCCISQSVLAYWETICCHQKLHFMINHSSLS